jgi:hypothetical protein
LASTCTSVDVVCAKQGNPQMSATKAKRRVRLIQSVIKAPLLCYRESAAKTVNDRKNRGGKISD